MTASNSSIRSDGDRKAFLARGLLSMGISCAGATGKSRAAQEQKKDKENPT